MGATTLSVTLSVTGVGLIVILIDAGVACALSVGVIVLQKVIRMKYTFHKKHYSEFEQTNNLF